MYKLVLEKSKLQHHVRSFFNPSKFQPDKFREMVQFAILGYTLAEVVVFVLLQQSASVGEMPKYITDVIIISISLIEFFVGPFIAWYGAGRRRNMILQWTLVAAACTVPLFWLPKPQVEGNLVLCNGSPGPVPIGMSSSTVTRLFLLILTAAGTALARVATWSQAQAYLDEYNPSLHVHKHFSIILTIRVVLLFTGISAVKESTETKLWLQAVFLTLGIAVTCIMIWRYPPVPPNIIVSDNNKDFIPSLQRVLRNKLVMVQFIAMSLLASALWGFTSKYEDIVKVKHHIIPSRSETGNFSVILSALPIVLATVINAYRYSQPLMSRFDKTMAMGKVAKVTFLSVILYVIMTARLNCEKGTLAGMNDNTYNPPACGRSCGCDRPWTEFTPVCMTEQMVTFYSPCHAGCSNSTILGGIEVYTNCSCGTITGQVTAGACSDRICADANKMHLALLTVVVLFSVLALSWQGAVALESVDRSDKSVAMGVGSAVISLVTFVGAHCLYFVISMFSCARFEGQTCDLQNSLFPTRVGYTSAILALLAWIMSLSTWIILKKKKENKEDSDLSLS